MGHAKIHGSEFPVQKIFSNEFVFKIPVYQRPYAWTTEQAGELFDDLILAMNDNSRGIPIEELNPYFLGSVVLIKEENNPESYVIDGQQRLTTLLILLSVIREFVPPNYAKDLTKYLYEEGDLLTDTSNHYRLSLRDKDDEFFRHNIFAEHAIVNIEKLDVSTLNDSQKNISLNTLLFIENLKKLSDDQRIQLAKYIIQQCFLVVVTTPDLDSAYRIFSVLNNRGLDLLDSDILKAEIIGNISEKNREKYANLWEFIEEELGRDDFNKLIGHIRMIFRKSKPRDTILKEFREYVIKRVNNSEKLINEVLNPFASAYSDMVNESFESASGAEKINEYFHWLGRIDNKDWIPPVIMYLAKNRDHPDNILTFLKYIERLAAGMMILRYNVNDRIERYGRVLEILDKNEDFQLNNSPLQLTDYEKEKILTILNGDFYSAKAFRTYVLLRLDAALSSGGARYDYPIITIEHVLPQNPKTPSQWTEWFPDILDQLRYVDKLGNLVLLTRKKNSQANNYEFEIKKKTYFTTGNVSPFHLTTTVLAEKEWTPTVIEKRQILLIGKIKEIWQL